MPEYGHYLSGGINPDRIEISPPPLPSTTIQKPITVTAGDGSTISGNHIGDKHYHGLSIEEVEKMAESLAKVRISQVESENDAKDQIIRSLQDAINALSKQYTSSKNIQEALDALAKGDTREAEEIFDEVATEARRTGKEANLTEAEALRHLGALAYLHDTKKAFNAYKRSTELDPENWEGWNMLGILYSRIGVLEYAEKAYMAVIKLTHDRTVQAIANGNLGNVYRIRGELDKAVEYWQSIHYLIS